MQSNEPGSAAAPHREPEPLLRWGSSRSSLAAVPPVRRTVVAVVWVCAALGSLAVVSSALVIESAALFADTAESTSNSFSAGSVDLVDDDLGTALFTVADMAPGQTTVGCITVTYQGTIGDPASVRLYSGGYVDSGDLATHLNLTIEEGAGGTFGDCTGFTSEATIESGGTLSAFDGAHTDYASGAGSWDPATTPESKTYRITVELDASTPSAEQGESVTAATFVWEVQS